MTTSRFDRRMFLRRAGLTGAGTAALLAGLPRPPARADAALAPFLHGVASGDPLMDRVMLWTRVTPRHGRSDVPVRWVVARDPRLRQVVRRGSARAGADRDHTIKVDVTGLEPDRWYFYAFHSLGRWSLVGRTRTAPSGGVDALRLGVVSCSNYPQGYFNAYARMAERNDLDVVVHLGDYIYEYGEGEYGDTRAVEPRREAAVLADYRTRYAHYRLDPDLRRLHQLYPFVVVWDDHESANDSWSGGAENHGDGDVLADAHPWSRRKAEAQRAFDEWLPVRTGDPARIYRTLRFGDLADLIMLDTRLEGRDEPVSPALEPTLFRKETEDPDRQMFSSRQRGFLFDALSRSDATWRLLGQQVMLMPWNAGGLPAEFDDERLADFPLLGMREGGNAVNADAWDGYIAERNRLYDHLEAEGIGNVVVLTGDIHTSWAADLPRDPYDPRGYDPVTGRGSLGVEFVTPSVTSANVNEILGEKAGTSLPEGSSTPIEAAIRADNPHVRYVDLDRHGYLVLDLTRTRIQADWWFVDRLDRPSNGEHHGSSWQVADGAGHLARADRPVPVTAVAPMPPTTPIELPAFGPPG